MTNQTLLTQASLNQFTGDLDRYRHGIHRCVIYTPGIRYLAEQGSAWWLIDTIAIYQRSRELNKAIFEDQRLQWLQFWRLDVQSDQTACLTCQADSDTKPVIVESIGYTDFPLDHVDIWVGYDNRFWTIYLPSEH